METFPNKVHGYVVSCAIRAEVGGEPIGKGTDVARMPPVYVTPVARVNPLAGIGVPLAAAALAAAAAEDFLTPKYMPTAMPAKMIKTNNVIPNLAPPDMPGLGAAGADI
jgi:hypothetical protein